MAKGQQRSNREKKKPKQDKNKKTAAAPATSLQMSGKNQPPKGKK